MFSAFTTSTRARCAAVFALALAAASFVATPARAQTNPLQLRDGYTIVLYDAAGKVMTWEQFQSYSGRLRWELQSDKPVDPHALNLLRSGRQAAMQGDFASAIDIFEDAHRNAPFWEYPIYEMAWACLLSGDFDTAAASFAQVNELAPHGFFNSQQAADCLRRERENEVAPGTYQRIVQLDRASHDTALLVVRTMVDKWPGYAAGWERLAFFSSDNKEILNAVTRGLAAHPDPFTRDSLRMRKALVANAQGRTADAITALEKMLADPDLSMSVEAQIKIALPGLRRSLTEGAKEHGSTP